MPSPARRELSRTDPPGPTSQRCAAVNLLRAARDGSDRADHLVGEPTVMEANCGGGP